jgi:site-specific DNA-methyltransferase (adenine-specific)
MGYLLINGDSRRLPIDLAAVDAVVADPPYGMAWDNNGARFTKGGCEAWEPTVNDDQPFDPSPWLRFSKAILWGSNHFSARLPIGTTLVWIKRKESAYGTFLSDAEVAWMKGGHGVYCMQITPDFQGRLHSNQKPIALMRWCIRLLKLPPNSLILDPYAGVGTTIIAALAEGHRAIGIEIDPGYCTIARRRLERPHAVVPRPGRVEHHPLFGDAP